MERREAERVKHVRVRPALQHEPHEIDAVPLARHVQRRAAPRVLRVRVSSGLQQEPRAGDVASAASSARFVQRRPSVGVGHARVRASLQQELRGADTVTLTRRTRTSQTRRSRSGPQRRAGGPTQALSSLEHASCSGVRGRRFGSAPCSSNSSRTRHPCADWSGSLLWHAGCSSVMSAALVALASAPALSRSSTHATWRTRSSAASVVAAARSRPRRRPAKAHVPDVAGAAAAASGVSPSALHASTSAPASSRSRTHSHGSLALAFAQCGGVFQFLSARLRPRPQQEVHALDRVERARVCSGVWSCRPAQAHAHPGLHHLCHVIDGVVPAVRRSARVYSSSGESTALIRPLLVVSPSSSPPRAPPRPTAVPSVLHAFSSRLLKAHATPAPSPPLPSALSSHPRQPREPPRTRAPPRGRGAPRAARRRGGAPSARCEPCRRA